MSTSKSSRVRSSIAFVLSILTVGLAIWLFTNRQYVLDQLTVWSYHPSASIASLDERVQFTDKGLFTFYATQPVVAEPSEFNSKCPRREAGSPILGCYTSDDRIYVFNMSNVQLDGMKEVTAAHEMLHAVWQRMGTDEQTRLAGLLTAAYEKNASPELRERMKYYERNEPDAISNELHSILGTEVAGLGAELDAYYGQYFENRQVILDLHSKYNTVYQSLYSRADQLYKNMETLSASIETRSTQYDQDVARLSTDIDSFNNRANNGNFDSMNQFNSERAALISRSNQLDSQRSAINRDIATYGQLYDEYQSIASQIEVLNNSIDSFKALGETPTV
ncbi:MAG: hypothetical protein JWO54_922 [Candidatus Saccharibacteria bacterium]|nr:hypothetical protein [Candidatus Saccharibacteria bacterium]MDB5181159.1 hypothetical protein [Candidatus Saccharibacteria bacterium]